MNQDAAIPQPIPHGTGTVDNVVLVPGAGEPARAVAPVETRLAITLALVRHDGIAYGIGDKIPVSLASYVELLRVGAIVEKPWDELDMVF